MLWIIGGMKHSADPIPRYEAKFSLESVLLEIPPAH